MIFRKQSPLHFPQKKIFLSQGSNPRLTKHCRLPFLSNFSVPQIQQMQLPVKPENRTKVSFRLYIPGPVEVSEETLKAMGTPMIGHRSPEFVELYQSVQPDLQKLFYTSDPVFISTSSAWGVMEGSLRNVVKKGVLNCMSGAFSDKWYDVSKRCGKHAKALQYE